ncbi:ATP-binding cassette domain-containing protein [Treponema sp. OMZ 792]|uniref:ABC transporter ATP-binding protein/permease n=1 Tax=unclassified Treponema TaxID=2638727 RepID=UPI0020A2CD46|nr:MULTISPECIES: ATP-binding cassette domain-containing protein [unclassified Treponema]UTC75469.1 ATP-binding cassette domain-containing protein [Treponema sp. OMZ 792]UTC79472.1 ATP-binding cassette domain-containing protein [Treponema sp. OMZ 798]
MLELKNINKSYKIRAGLEQRVLKDLNIVFGDKGLVSILGRSGGGKSTILNIIGGLCSFDSGEIFYNNKKVEDYNEFRKSKIAFVFQDFNLINHLSSEDNIIAGMTDSITGGIKKRKEHSVSILKSLNIGEFTKKKPTQLSGGQRQRLAIARMLAKEVDIILADEATSSLDKKNAHHIMDILKDISKEKLVIFVTHDKELAYEYSDRIISLIDGQILKDENITKDINAESGNSIKSKLSVPKKNNSYKKNTRYLPLKNLKGRAKASIRNIIIIGLIFLSILFSIFMESDYFKNYMHDIYLQEGIKTSVLDVAKEKLSDETLVEELNMQYKELPNIEHCSYTYNTRIKIAGSNYIEGLQAGKPVLSYTNLEDISSNNYFKKIITVGRFPKKADEVLMSSSGAIALLKELKIGGERLEDQFNTGKLDDKYVFSLVENAFFFVAEYRLPKIKITGLIDSTKVSEKTHTVYFIDGFTNLFEIKKGGLYKHGLKLYKTDLSAEKHTELLNAFKENKKIRVNEVHQKRVSIAYNKIASFFDFSRILLILICSVSILSLISIFYTTVLERKNEIRIYRSLAYTKKEIVKIFSLEIFYTSLVSAIFAVIILTVVYYRLG